MAALILKLTRISSLAVGCRSRPGSARARGRRLGEARHGRGFSVKNSRARSSACASTRPRETCRATARCSCTRRGRTTRSSGGCGEYRDDRFRQATRHWEPVALRYTTTGNYNTAVGHHPPPLPIPGLRATGPSGQALFASTPRHPATRRSGQAPSARTPRVTATPPSAPTPSSPTPRLPTIPP